MKTSPLNSFHAKHAVKSALASVSAYALTLLFHLPMGYWAVVSVILVMQANLGGSLRIGLNRIVGTALGAILGALCLHVAGASPWAEGASLGLVILVCAALVHLHESFRMAGMTAAIIILMGGQSDNYLDFAAARFFEIGIGVAVALAYSALLWPSRAGLHLREGVSRALHDEAAFYSILLCCREDDGGEHPDEAQARAQLEATRDRNASLLAEAKREPGGLSRSGHITVSLFNFSERIAEHLLSMEHAVHYEELETLHELVAKDMDVLAQTTITAMTRLALAISQERDPGPMADLERAMAAAEDCLTRVRRERVLPSYSLESVMRFFSYYYNMKQVAVELTGMAGRAAMLGER